MALNRTETFVFPYLSENSEDYKDTSFTSECRVKEDSNGSIQFEVSYGINNEELAERIKSKDLNVVCEINCSSLRKRIVKRFDAESNTLFIDDETMNFEGKTQVICYLVAAKDVYYSNSKLNGAREGEFVYIQKHNIIGESNVNTFYIYHDRDYGRKSIFNFVPVQDMADTDPIRVNLDGERIVFSLSEKRKKELDDLQADSSSLIISATVLPIFTQILEFMKEKEEGGEPNEFNSTYGDKGWYIVLKNKYEKLFDENPEESTQNSYVRAQALLNNIVYQNFDYGIVAQIKAKKENVDYEG